MYTVNEVDSQVNMIPLVVRADEGPTMAAGPQCSRVVFSSAQTGGAFAMAEAQIDAPGFGPPYHVHTREDETFIVLEGELVLIVDGARSVLKAGDVAFAPRNVPHRFESGPNGVRILAMVSGSNFERFYPRYAQALAAGDMERLPQIADEHGITFLPEA